MKVLTINHNMIVYNLLELTSPVGRSYLTWPAILVLFSNNNLLAIWKLVLTCRDWFGNVFYSCLFQWMILLNTDFLCLNNFILYYLKLIEFLQGHKVLHLLFWILLFYLSCKWHTLQTNWSLNYQKYFKGSPKVT